MENILKEADEVESEELQSQRVTVIWSGIQGAALCKGTRDVSHWPLVKGLKRMSISECVIHIMRKAVPAGEMLDLVNNMGVWDVMSTSLSFSNGVSSVTAISFDEIFHRERFEVK